MPDRRRARPARWLVAGIIAGLLTIAAWALSAAPASSPDDNFHLPSIWCSHGIESPQCEAVPGEPEDRSLPVQATVEITCYATQPLESAACQDEVIAQTGKRSLVGFGNWQREYPPVYYWVNGWLVTGHTVASMVAMRGFTGAAVLGLVTLLALLVPRRMRPVAVVPLLVLSVPLGLSLFASTNPSAWGIAGPGAVWLALHAAFATEGRRQTGLCGVAMLAALMGAGARADACLFTAMAVAIAFLLNWDRLRSRLLPTGAGLFCVALAAFLFLGANQSGALSAGLASQQVIGDGSSMSTLELTVANLGQLPTLWTGFLGTTPIGWIDTAFPGIVPFLSVAVVTVLLALTWRRASRRHTLAIALAGLAMFVYPMVILVRSNLTVGQGVQPRYLLPIAVIFLGLVLLTSDGRLSRLQAGLLAGGLSIAQTVALHVQLRRYVTGLDVSGWNLDKDREWWWPDLPFGPTLVWVVGSVAFAVLAFAVLRVCAEDRVPEVTG